MILLTGGAGFIGSCLLRFLNSRQEYDIVVCDSLGSSSKWKNLRSKVFVDYVDKDSLFEYLTHTKISFKAVIHMGACSSTTESNASYLMENNFLYSKKLALWAKDKKARFIYASSGAVYGDGSLGYSDSNEVSFKLKPLNMYGFSKLLFDQWIIRNGLDKEFVGLRFFNVYGPNEYHKQDMRSMVCKGYYQVRETGRLKLFKSYNPEYENGGQKRDFVYIEDVLKVVNFFLKHRDRSGIYNVGTGRAYTWNELARALFSGVSRQENIEYIDMPSELRQKYQYYTCADISKLRQTGYNEFFLDVENGVKKYLKYLENGEYF